MSKFNVNDEVIVIATGEKGVVKAKEVTKANDGNKKHITIQYMVKVGDGFSNWKVFYRRELQKAPKKGENEGSKHLIKIYDAANGYKVTLVALAERYEYYKWEYNLDGDVYKGHKGKNLNIGYSIYNPSDEYNEKLGISIAKKRSQTRPFAHMSSEFSGEFNKETIEAIMDVKAKYIIDNIDKFTNK